MSFEPWMGKHPRLNTPWTDDEERVLIENFKAGASLKQLCKHHGRAEGGINSQLLKILGYNFYQPQEVQAVKTYTTLDQAAHYAAIGYRRTSNRFCMLSRIDRADWLQVLAQQMGRAIADFYTPDGNLSVQWADYYRRSMTKDTITVSEEISRLVPGSSGDECGYIPKGVA